MTTIYPADLPGVPADRWNATMINTINAVDDEGNNTPIINMTIDADSQDQAERRALAHIDYDYEDDLRGARAEASLVDGVWYVAIFLAPYR